MTGIFDRRHTARPRARRCGIARRRHLVIQGLMRPVVVVFPAEPREAAVLRAAIARGWPRRLGFQHPMKLFMRPILLGSAQGNALRQNPEPDPPDGQPRQAAQTRTRKRPAVVTAHPVGQPIFGEGPLEAPAGRLVGAARQRIAPQHEAAEGIAQRQGITVDPISRPEFSFEVRGPRRVRPGDGGQW